MFLERVMHQITSLYTALVGRGRQWSPPPCSRYSGRVALEGDSGRLLTARYTRGELPRMGNASNHGCTTWSRGEHTERTRAWAQEVATGRTNRPLESAQEVVTTIG